MKEAHIIKKVYSDLYTITDFFFPSCEIPHSVKILLVLQ